ncbi:hypothetical protein B0I35DRAFT_138797 [Stachybotrys elegans]|uniref:Uncharacterized protein n=1 Tax=Stachybotrys elegans TaxID=80388 RepID=A0A8K0SYZ2_9HYPO|nr:hypothetical protein B0I35DRAFT_138797 [Stachybotrys elegans]
MVGLHTYLGHGIDCNGYNCSVRTTKWKVVALHAAIIGAFRWVEMMERSEYGKARMDITTRQGRAGQGRVRSSRCGCEWQATSKQLELVAMAQGAESHGMKRLERCRHTSCSMESPRPASQHVQAASRGLGLLGCVFALFSMLFLMLSRDRGSGLAQTIRARLFRRP